MITVSRQTSAELESVWAVMADGWSYAAWVVGSSRIRAVERSWPAEGARIHHSVGAWPILLHDETVVVHCDPGHLLRLRAKTRPIGEAVVEIELHRRAAGVLIEMREDAPLGPVRFVPKPLRQAAITPRNAETLRRLALLAERNTSPEDTATL